MPRHDPVSHRPGFQTSAVRLLNAALGAVALVLLSGCGGKTGEINGKVYYKGQVVTSGFVTVVGSDGIAKNSEIAEDGSYRIATVAAGEVKIAVSSPPLDAASGKPGQGGNARKAPEARGGNEGPIASETQKKSWREIPITYSDITRTNLKYTIVAGPNSYDIKLE